MTSWTEGVVYLLWPQFHLCDPGRVYHGFGPAQVLYQTLPLGRQAHKAAVLGIKWGVDTMFKVLGRWYLRPLLFLLAKHPQVHEGNSLPASKCPCREKYSSFNKLHSTLHRHSTCPSYCNLDFWKSNQKKCCHWRTTLLYYLQFDQVYSNKYWQQGRRKNFKWLI